MTTASNLMGLAQWTSIVAPTLYTGICIVATSIRNWKNGTLTMSRDHGPAQLDWPAAHHRQRASQAARKDLATDLSARAILGPAPGAAQSPLQRVSCLEQSIWLG